MGLPELAAPRRQGGRLALRVAPVSALATGVFLPDWPTGGAGLAGLYDINADAERFAVLLARRHGGTAGVFLPPGSRVLRVVWTLPHVPRSPLVPFPSRCRHG